MSDMQGEWKNRNRREWKMQDQPNTQKGFWIDCPTCDGSGSVTRNARSGIERIRCITCVGEGGHYFEKRTLDRVKKENKGILRELMYGRK